MSTPLSLRTHRHGFTLIELLVVISIIALLVSILLPALGAARETARTTQCLAQIRQMALANHLYADDYKGHMLMDNQSGLPAGVPLVVWTQAIRPYLNLADTTANPLPKALQCPSMAQRGPDGLTTQWWESSYGLNWMLGGTSTVLSWPGAPGMDDVYQPSKVALMADFTYRSRVLRAYDASSVHSNPALRENTFVHNQNEAAAIVYVGGNAGVIRQEEWDAGLKQGSTVTSSPSAFRQPWNPWGPGQYGTTP